MIYWKPIVYYRGERRIIRHRVVNVCEICGEEYFYGDPWKRNSSHYCPFCGFKRFTTSPRELFIQQEERAQRRKKILKKNEKYILYGKDE